MQVHPSPDYADQHDDAHLKSEAWYIVKAEPGAVIYKGIREGVTPDQLRQAIEKNTDEAVVPLMVEVPVKEGGLPLSAVGDVPRAGRGYPGCGGADPQRYDVPGVRLGPHRPRAPRGAGDAVHHLRPRGDRRT